MKFFRLLAIVLLSFVGITAVVGAIPLILHPRQQPWHMSPSLLERSPFPSFLVPGIILLVFNGALCLFILTATLRRRAGYGWWVAAQGCVLLGWIITECAMIRLVIWPQYLYGAIGVALIIAGCSLRHDSVRLANLRQPQ